MQSLDLKPKFDPYILNKTTDPHLIPVRDQLKKIFHAHVNPDHLNLSGFKPISSQKYHILTHSNLPGWIIKAPRKDQYNCCDDQHIYRIRKMLRVQQVIEKYGMTEVIAPKKFLYEFKGKWFVIAEKMDLDKTKIDNVFWEKPVPRTQLKPLTAQQAREIAIICYEAGLSDMGAHNLGYLKTGEVCPFDSEPLTRGIKKKWKRFPIPGIGIAVNFFLAKCNADRLYRICHTPEAQQAVEEVQQEMLVKHIAKMVSLAALPLLITLGAALLSPAVITSSALALTIKAACVLSGLNAVSSLALLGLSIHGEHFTGPLEYEGDLIEKFG